MGKFTDIKYFNRLINKQDGGFFSSNMREDGSGICAGYSLVNKFLKATGTKTANMGVIKGFAQTGKANNVLTFAKDENNSLFLMSWGGNYITQINEDGQSIAGTSSKGIALLPGGEIISTGNKYVTKTHTTTLAADIDASQTSIEVASYPSDFSGIKYAVILKGTDNRDSEVIKVGSNNANTITGATRAQFNTTATTHSSGATIIIVADSWRNTGDESITSTMPICRFENKTFIGRGSTVVGFDDDDDGGASTIPTKLSLPANEDIVGFGILTGSTDYVLIAVNVDESSKIYVWDGVDTKWTRAVKIENRNISAIDSNIFSLEDGIYQTDGVNINLITTLPDMEDRVAGVNSINVGDIKKINNYILFTSNTTGLNRNRVGLWIYKIDSQSLGYVAPSGGGFYGSEMGAIHSQSDTSIFVSSDFNNGSIDLLSILPSKNNNYFQFIWNPNDGREYTIESLELDIDAETYNYYNNSDFDFDVIIRAYDFKRPFLQYGQTADAPDTASEIKITNTLGLPQVGDRIEIVERSSSAVNSFAGQPRNITAVTLNVDNRYVCALDSALDGVVNATPMQVIINPLKKIKEISVNSSILPKFKFPLTSQLTGNKIMFEIEFRCGNTNICPRLNALTIKGERHEL